jgi:hypothetical protein
MAAKDVGAAIERRAEMDGAIFEDQHSHII